MNHIPEELRQDCLQHDAYYEKSRKRKTPIRTLIRWVSEFFYKKDNIDLYSDRITVFGLTTTKERILP